LKYLGRGGSTPWIQLTCLVYLLVYLLVDPLVDPLIDLLVDPCALSFARSNLPDQT